MNLTPLDNHLRLDGGAATNGDMGLELTPIQLRLDTDASRHGVEPPSPKVRCIWDWNMEMEWTPDR